MTLSDRLTYRLPPDKPRSQGSCCPSNTNRIQQLSHQGTSGLQPHAPVGTLLPGCSWAGATCGWDVGSSQSHPTHIGCRCTCTAMTWTWKNMDKTSKARRIEHPRIDPLISLYDTINCYILLPLIDVFLVLKPPLGDFPAMFDSRRLFLTGAPCTTKTPSFQLTWQLHQGLHESGPWEPGNRQPWSQPSSCDLMWRCKWGSIM